MLGYTQASWDNDSKQEKQPASSEKYWGQLTHDERAAAAVLGYSELTWDKLPAAMRQRWIELTEHERAAARALGYKAWSWDKYSRQQRKPTLMTRAWIQLTQHERAAAVVLGYTEEAWDGTASQPTAAQKKWNELTSCGWYFVLLVLHANGIAHCRLSVAVGNVCTCKNGVAETGAHCPVGGGAKCLVCNAGWTVNRARTACLRT